MKTFLTRFATAFAVVFMISFGITGCGPEEDPEVAVTGVSVSQGSLTLEPGGTANLTATVSPSNATDKTVAWSTSNQSVATVSGGTVTAVGEGTATITATAGGRTASCTVTVNKKVIAVSSVTLDKTEANLKIGEEITLAATVKPEDATDKTVNWTTSSADIAKVDNGKVIAVAVGEATITAKAGGKEATCKITVKPTEVESIELDKTEAELENGGTLTLTATVKPDDATDKTVTWISSDETIATVEDGTMTAKAAGTVTITAKAGDKEATCIVTVIPNEEDRIKAILMEFYDALDGPHWEITNDEWKWDLSKSLSSWYSVNYDRNTHELMIQFSRKIGLKGEIPESFGELGESLVIFSLSEEPDLEGTLPDSFRRLTGLNHPEISMTSMTSLPDVFKDMNNLSWVQLSSNDKMTGPLPESIGNGPLMEFLHIVNNRFTGSVPASWARIGTGLALCDNCLSGNIPDTFVQSDYFTFFVEEVLPQKEGYGFDITDIEIPGYRCWPDGAVEDLEGNAFSFKEVIAKNKYTVYVSWSPWDPFSEPMMAELMDLYDLCHEDGLEIIATVQNPDYSWKNQEEERKEVKKRGYDKWYNFHYTSSNFMMFVPAAEVYDSAGNIVFSGFLFFPDPERNRFSRVASIELVPFLEDLFKPEIYTSTDYSKDGEVMTLQKASKGKGINLVFMGDAYTDKDMGEGGLYETVMNEAMDEFFSVEPYKTFKNRFNVYAVKVVSPNGKIGSGYNTALASSFGTGTTILGDDPTCYSYALKVPGITNQENLMIGVLVNSSRSVGTTSMSYLRQSGVSYITTAYNQCESFGPVLRHEAGGHAFAFLADEYSNFDETAPAEHVENYNSMYQKYGWYSNVDFTNDPAKIRWSAFLSDARYKDEVGIFEGAALYGKGAYRPSEKSIMRYLDESDTFNAPCRWKIYQQIMLRSGEECSFEKFLEYDAVNRGKAQSSARRTRSGTKHEPLAPPVVRP